MSLSGLVRRAESEGTLLGLIYVLRSKSDLQVVANRDLLHRS